MKITLNNALLKPTAEMLYSLPLKGKISRQRSRIVRAINEHIKEVEQQRVDIAEEHAEKGSDGKPLIQNKNYVILDMMAFNRDVDELYKECTTIADPNLEEPFAAIKEVLEETEQEFSGAHAEEYDALLDTLEGGAE